MRVVVTGGRNHKDQKYVWDSLDWFCKNYEPIIELVDGWADGVDTFASNWCKARQVINIRVPAQWDKFGKSAGHRRNFAMLHVYQPEYCLAFDGGKGTKDMVKQAIHSEYEIKLLSFGFR